MYYLLSQRPGTALWRALAKTLLGEMTILKWLACKIRKTNKFTFSQDSTRARGQKSVFGKIQGSISQMSLPMNKQKKYMWMKV